jgi:hypothetical protein
MTQPEHYDDIVLGSGAGGKLLAWHLAASGRRTAVVERRCIGGSCPNVACLPSKNEIWSAKVADLLAHGAQFGAGSGRVAVDIRLVRRRKREMVDNVVAIHVASGRHGRTMMRTALTAVVLAATLAGCAGVQSSDTRSAERALTAAGFEAKPADTPDKLTHLRSLPPRKVLVQEQNGQRRYVYADPTGCRCLYVGGEEQYRRLRQQEQAAADRLFAAESAGYGVDWGAWDLWP